MNIPIFTLHKSDKVKFNNDEKYHSVKSNYSMKKFSIILIEHCICESDKNIVIRQLIKCHEFLFNSLYPRTIKWTNDIPNREDNEIMNIINQKMENNCFENDSCYVLGNEISYFNHSNEPNCKVYMQPFNINGCITRIAFVILLKDIEPNEELFIEYNKIIKFENNKKYIDNQEIVFENPNYNFFTPLHI
jgi:hypothetical protein